MEPTYCYSAFVTRVIDGDTIVCDIDFGMNTWTHGKKIRLARINAPEPHTETRELGLAASKYLRFLIEKQWITLVSHENKDKSDSFNRYLADVFIQSVSYSGSKNKGLKWINVNDRLVEEGHAVFKEY